MVAFERVIDILLKRISGLMPLSAKCDMLKLFQHVLWNLS